MVIPSTFTQFTSHISTTCYLPRVGGFHSLYYGLLISHTQHNFIYQLLRIYFQVYHLQNSTTHYLTISTLYTVQKKLHAKIACVLDSILTSSRPAHLPHRNPHFLASPLLLRLHISNISNFPVSTFFKLPPSFLPSNLQRQNSLRRDFTFSPLPLLHYVCNSTSVARERKSEVAQYYFCHFSLQM